MLTERNVSQTIYGLSLQSGQGYAVTSAALSFEDYPPMGYTTIS